MKKRLIALLLTVLMVFSVALTSCQQDDGEIEAEQSRRSLTIKITCVTDESTTEEAVKAVQERINLITKQRFKTQIVLELITEDQYNEYIDNRVADIALVEQQKADEESLSESAEKESKRISAIDKLILNDKAEVTRMPLFVEPEEEETTEGETYETEQNILGENVEKYPEVTDTQLDIFLICGTENLNKYVTDETYATDGESFLVAMDEYLTLDAKDIAKFVNPTILLAGKVQNRTYAIPTNKRIADESTYLIINRDLYKKYVLNAPENAENRYTEDSPKSLTSKALSFFLQQLKEQAPDVAPMLSACDAPGIVGLFQEDTIFGTYVANTTVAGFKAQPKNLLSAYQYTDHYIYMKQYERNGYIWPEDKITEDTVWGCSVVTGDDSVISEYDDDDYIKVVLEKGIATSESAGQYMFGISKYTADPQRCMEIITFLNTNSEFRNLLQYGIEGVNYKIDAETRKLVRLNDEYMMNIYATGNTFIAYPEEDMELDVWEKAKEANLATIVSPYMGFIFEDEENAELIAAVKALSDQILKRIEEYDVETDRLNQIDILTKGDPDLEIEITGSKSPTMEWGLENLQKRADYQLSLIEPLEAILVEAKAKVTAAEEALVPYTEAYKVANTNLAVYTKVIDNLEVQLTRYQTMLEEELKKAEDAETAETTAEGTAKPTGPDPEKVAEYEAKIAELTLDIKEQEGYARPYREAFAKANEEYLAMRDILSEAEDEYNAITFTEVNDEGEEEEKKAGVALTSRQKNYEATLKVIANAEKALAALQLPTEEELNTEYADLQALYAQLQDEAAALAAAVENLGITAQPTVNSITELTDQITALAEDLAEAEDTLKPFARERAIAYYDYFTAVDALEAAEEGADTAALQAEVDKYKAVYDAKVAEAKEAQDAVDAVEAQIASLEEQIDTLEADATYVEYNLKKEELNAKNKEVNTTKKAVSGFTLVVSDYYDEIAENLYNTFFESLIEECELDPNYQIFMNVDDQAENEKGVVYKYLEWYSSMYGG